MQKARCHPPEGRTPTACKRMVSGSISLLCSRFFSPFLHSTCSLSVSYKYLALPDGAGNFTQGVSDPALLRILLGSKWNSCTGLSPSTVLLSRSFHFSFTHSVSQSYNPCAALTAQVWAIPRSLATTWGITICFLFLRVLRCFSSPGLL
jgi:hypothetical protein